MVLLYSARFRRRAVTRPGSAAARRSARSSSVWMLCVTALICAPVGLGKPGGGISPLRTLRTILSHVSRLRFTTSTMEPAWPSDCKSSPPAFALLLWQEVQFWLKNAPVVLSNAEFAKAWLLIGVLAGAGAFVFGVVCPPDGSSSAVAKSGTELIGNASVSHDFNVVSPSGNERRQICEQARSRSDSTGSGGA